MTRPGVLLATLLALAPPAAASEGWSLERVVAEALERNPALKAVEERRAEVAAGVREARAEAFPQLDLTGSWSRSRNPSLLNSPDFEEFIRNFPGDFTPREQELYGLAVELSQVLFTAGKVGAAIDLARLAERIAEAQISTARLDTALAAAEAFYQLLEARKGLETAEIQQRSRFESLLVVEARYELGEATRLELLQSRAVLAELEPLLTEAEGGVEVAAIRLAALLGLDQRPAFEAVAEEGGLPGLPARQEALRAAREHRPELADLDLQRQALGEQQQATRADGLPQIDLTGSYGRTVRLPENLDDPLYADWFVGLGVRWELFDGGRRKGQIAQIESQREQLRWRLVDLRNRVEQEVEEALSGYRTALSRLQAAELSAVAAREAARVARESYDEGTALQADWLAAQEREIEAEVVRVQAFYGARIGAARLARALGLRPDDPWVWRSEGP